MKKMALGLIFACLVGCAGVQSDDPTAINDALVGFTVNSQAERWPEALRFVTADEADEITDENGLMKEEYRVAASRLRISALKRMPWKVDGKGRLIGIKEVLDDFNKKYVVSEDEKKIGSNLEQMRQERIKRTLERGQRIMAGEEEQANQEPEVEVITNKLTEDEKRKYGSTGELRAPEEVETTATYTSEESSEDSYSSESSSDDSYSSETSSDSEPAQVFEPENSNVEEDGYYGPDESGATSDF
ncbi:MAG: hypothetical protein K6A31_04540 [Fibrobacter sp.]|nr:hypothetical protein [Fibrobacter sp.]